MSEEEIAQGRDLEVSGLDEIIQYSYDHGFCKETQWYEMTAHFSKQSRGFAVSAWRIRTYPVPLEGDTTAFRALVERVCDPTFEGCSEYTIALEERARIRAALLKELT